MTRVCALFLVYFEPECGQASVAGVDPGARYEVRAFDPEHGTWADWTGGSVVADESGTIRLPAPPAEGDLAVRLYRLSADSLREASS